MTDLRVTWKPDPDSGPETPNGGPLPGPKSEYLENPILVDGAPLSYDEYCRTYGNPDRYYTVGAVLEARCTHCDSWRAVGSIWGIDLYDGDPDTSQIVTDRPEAVDARPVGSWLRGIVDDLVADYQHE